MPHVQCMCMNFSTFIGPCDYPFATWELARIHQGGSPIALHFWTDSGTASHVLSEVFKALVVCALSHEKAQVASGATCVPCRVSGISRHIKAILEGSIWTGIYLKNLEGRMSHSALAMEWEADGAIRDKARKLQLVSCPIFKIEIYMIGSYVCTMVCYMSIH